MRIKAAIGDNLSTATVGNVSYGNAQTVSFFYIMTADPITNNNQAEVRKERADTNIPQKPD